MKKGITFVFIICLMLFSSCQNEPTIMPIQCEDDEILVDGACQIVKTDFEKAFDATALMTNYTLSVSIQQLADLYEMSMLIDDDKSSFIMGDEIEFYEKTSTGYDYYFPVDDSYRKESITENPDGSGFHFFKDLEASWFQLVSDKYFLKSDYNDEVAVFFQDEFPGCVVSNLELVVGETYFEQLIFQVTIDSVMYHFTMTLSAIGETTVTLPTV